MQWRARAALGSIVLGCACGPRVTGDGADGGGSAESSGGVAETSATSATGADATTTTTTVGTSVGTETTIAVDGSSTDPGTSSEDSSFVQPPDVPMHPCDIWAQNCPEGSKCSPASTNGGPWDWADCVPIDPDAVPTGGACTVQESIYSGLDDCETGAFCTVTNGATLEGYCVAMCQGTPRDPVCADGGSTCFVVDDSFLAVCVATCDPLAPSCAAGTYCYPGSLADFECREDASGAMGSAGDPCEASNACDPGLFCAPESALPDCAGDLGCCAPLCDLTAMDDCAVALPGTVCSPWYSEGAAPPGGEDVGACVAL